MTWAEALAKAAGLAGEEPLFGLCHAREKVVLGRVEDGGLLVDEAGELAGRPFEARLFCRTFELRWLEAGGKAALLTEGKALADTFGGDPVELKVEWKLTPSYLLWGSGLDSPTDDWSRLGAARIGAYHAPIGGIGRDKRIHLHTIEYLAADEHGNVHLAAERLSHLAAEAAEWVADMEKRMPGART